MDVFLFESHPAPLLRSRVTLAKSKRWELERQLEELAVGTPARTTDRAGNETITYELPITGEIVGAHMKAALAKQWETHQRQRTIFEVVHHGDPFRMRAIGAFPAEAPDTTLQELDFKLRTNIGNGRDEMCVRDAKCRLGNYGAFFSPGGNARVHLEAHFDQPVRVSAVSTAARRAPRRSFPDQLWIEKHRSQARWKGDSYYILDRSATNASDVLFFPEYKLAYRPSRGAPWIPLGTFKGPRNNFEERLQTLEMADNLNERTSIRCIALRWTVSTEHEDMAKRGLRVAVFGPPDADNGKAVVSDPRDFASQGGSRRKESTVQYVLTKATVSHRKKKQGRSFYGRYDYDFKTSAKADRIRRAKEARGAIKDYNAK